jgi:hypothetical protein
MPTDSRSSGSASADRSPLAALLREYRRDDRSIKANGARPAGRGPGLRGGLGRVRKRIPWHLAREVHKAFAGCCVAASPWHGGGWSGSTKGGNGFPPDPVYFYCVSGLPRCNCLMYNVLSAEGTRRKEARRWSDVFGSGWTIW